jgi:hypothetical protein
MVASSAFMSARRCWLAWPQAPVPNDEHIAGLDCVAFTAAYECEIVAEDESGGGTVWPVHRNLLDGEIFYALREAPGLQTTGLCLLAMWPSARLPLALGSPLN